MVAVMAFSIMTAASGTSDCDCQGGQGEGQRRQCFKSDPTATSVEFCLVHAFSVAQRSGTLSK